MAGENSRKGRSERTERSVTEEKTGALIMSFTVAECGEFHSLGEYHENVKTVEKAAELYRRIPKERMHGVPAIGIKLHKKGQPAYEDMQIDILSGGVIDKGMLRYVPEAENNPSVQEAVEQLIRLFPEKEVVDF